MVGHGSAERLAVGSCAEGAGEKRVARADDRRASEVYRAITRGGGCTPDRRPPFFPSLCLARPRTRLDHRRRPSVHAPPLARLRSRGQAPPRSVSMFLKLKATISSVLFMSSFLHKDKSRSLMSNCQRPEQG